MGFSRERQWPGEQSLSTFLHAIISDKPCCEVSLKGGGRGRKKGEKKEKGNEGMCCNLFAIAVDVAAAACGKGGEKKKKKRG